MRAISKSFVKLGNREIPLDNRHNLGGTCRTLDACDGKYRLYGDRKEKVKLDHGILSTDGVAVLDDSHSLLFLDDGKLHLREHEEVDLYVFAYGQDYRGALRGLYAICGAPVYLPRYAFGNWWSHDIGGFMRGEKCGELYVRYLQFGALHPSIVSTAPFWLWWGKSRGST